MLTRGTKRNLSNPDDTTYTSQGKRVGVDVQRALESSERQLGISSMVDSRRVELANKHVRALNTQFASWVQSQLHNHPDELWEDGVRDYLSHASNVMEKFSDVVAWLKANTIKEEASRTTHASQTLSDQKSLLESNGKVQPDADIFTRSESAKDGAASCLPNKWISSALSSHKNSFLQGNQSFTQAKVETNADPDEENDVDQPSSPSLKKVEEKGIIIAHEVKCKVYVKPDNPADKGWKDIGMGMLSIKCKEDAAKATKESKPTIVVRNDVGKILLNALIYPGIKINVQKNTIASIFHTTSAGVGIENADTNVAAVARTYLLRLKTEEDAKKLATAIEEYAPST